MRLIFLYGPPASGKYTVGVELQKLTGFPLFHNHVSVDMVTTIFPFGTPGFSRLCRKIRLATFKEAAIEKLPGLIFTFVYSHPDDASFVQEVTALIKKHGGEVCFVRLDCDKETLDARVENPDRALHGKINTKDVLESLLNSGEFWADVPAKESLVLNTADLTPQESARRIVEHYGLAVQDI